MPKRDFEKILAEAVDEGLHSLGQSSRRAIYFHLEKNFDVKKQEIPSKIEVFADAIEKIFGSGANFLEILIVNRLHEKIGELELKIMEKKGYKFSDYVKELKEKCG